MLQHGRVLAADAKPAPATGATQRHQLTRRLGGVLGRDPRCRTLCPGAAAEKPQWVEAGEAVPDGMDAILSLEAVVLKNSGAEALAGGARRKDPPSG